MSSLIGPTYLNGPDMTLPKLIKDKLSDYNAWHLSGDAECASPDSLTSPGAAFLASTRDALVEALDYLSTDELHDQADVQDTIHEVADGAPDVYTYPLWQQFLDLGAWAEDTSDLGQPDDMETGARWALYGIASRLCTSLVDEACTALESATESALESARDLGTEHGTNAAGWYLQEVVGGRSNGDPETAASIVRGIDDGDPMVLDTFPHADFSGQWADGLTVEGLLADTDLDGIEAESERVQEVVDAYRDAFDTAVSDEVERVCRDMLDAAAREVPDAGGYVSFAVMDDGEALCSTCVQDETNPVHIGGDADGWRVDGWDHSGNVDDEVRCSHCDRVIVEGADDQNG